MRYFAVTCRHGHFGTKRYQPITFAVQADDIFEACEKAKAFPGVKHTAPVLRCAEISHSEFEHLSSINAYERMYGRE